MNKLHVYALRFHQCDIKALMEANNKMTVRKAIAIVLSRYF